MLDFNSLPKTVGNVYWKEEGCVEILAFNSGQLVHDSVL